MRIRPAIVGATTALALVGTLVAAAPSTPADQGEVAAVVQASAKRFWTKDTTRYRSPWYEGRRRIMIPFGCTRAPYYPLSARCEYKRGFHHGIDMAMPCGTRLFSDVRGRVVRPAAAGSLGSAYGRKAFRIRHDGTDYVFGHVKRVFVSPGDRLRRGQLIAKAGDLGAPDGCHLHFEVRPAKASYIDAVNPRPPLQLRAPD